MSAKRKVGRPLKPDDERKSVQLAFKATQSTRDLLQALVRYENERLRDAGFGITTSPGNVIAKLVRDQAVRVGLMEDRDPATKILELADMTNAPVLRTPEENEQKRKRKP